MREILKDLMDAASRRADYADVRHVRSRAERLSVRGGSVDAAHRSEEEGIGVRVRLGGGWGFAAARGSARAAAEEALERAIAVAEAEPGRRANGARMAPEPPASGRYTAGVGPGEDPFAVPVSEKLAVLVAAEEAMRGDPRLRVTSAHFLAFGEEKVFASSEGALVEQATAECGGGIVAQAVEGGEAQVRSYPASFRGDVAQAGYGHFAALDLEGHAPRVAEQALALLSAPVCPAERTTLILDGEQLALQLHESVGHAVELDRILGTEASYAGTSFLSPTDLGRRRYGSGLMNVTADATTPGGLGSFGWDDEGVPARATPIVREGVLTGFLSSRESAAEVGLERSAGCMRAAGFARQPLVRMTNVHLEPGEAGSLEDLIADTDHGVLMETNRSWSIDSRRLHFQFATELAYEIRGGRRARLLRNPSYAGTTPEFWAGLDAVCSRSDWRLRGVINCGKGEPGQAMRVSHGTSPARFRDVQVGVA
jgi:TldD protein